MESVQKQPFWYHNSFWIGIYALLVVVVVLKELITEPHIDNFIIFRNSFEHMISGKRLYGFYPDEYRSLYNYGPTFPVLASIFWLMPYEISAFVWNFTMAFLLLWAVRSLPVSLEAKAFISFISLNELFTHLLNFQTNTAVTACIIFTWLFLWKNKPQWAAAVVAFGFTFKVYPAIAGVFILFYLQHFWKFIGWGIFWLIVWVALPLLFISPEQLVFHYQGWWEALNIHNKRIAMSAMQLLNLAIGTTIPNHYLMSVALVMLLISFSKPTLWHQLRFQLYALASVLIFITIFNPAAESPTYIIAFTGLGIWLSQRPLTKKHLALLLFVLIFGSLSTTDIFPADIRALYVYHYQLKALPYVIAWCVLWWETITFNISDELLQSSH